MYGKETLFHKFDGHSAQDSQKKRLQEELRNLSESEVRGTSIIDWENHFFDEYKIDVPVIDRNDVTLQVNDTKVDARNHPSRFHIHDRGQPVLVDGVQIIMEIPYTGDKALFYCSGNKIAHRHLDANIHDDQISIEYNLIEQDPDKVNQMTAKDLDYIESHLSSLKNYFESFNSSIKPLVQQEVNQRIEKFKKDDDLKSKLKIPLKQRTNAPQTYITPNVRKKIAVARPTPKPESKFQKAEPVISNEDYNQILKICTNMATVMEKSPHAFKEMGEEDIRQHFLLQLNGQYEGNATGETFNYEGKTDILIKEDSKNIFIAECKFWKGPKTVEETIDQILGYTGWRDTKTAIFLFSRNKNFTEVLNQISDLVKKHSNFISEMSAEIDAETEFRFKFKQRDDHEREIFLTFLLFNVPR